MIPQYACSFKCAIKPLVKSIITTYNKKPFKLEDLWVYKCDNLDFNDRLQNKSPELAA